MGKIAEAQAVVERIEAEIEDMRRQLMALRHELAGLLSSFEPDDVARADALRASVERLQDELPRVNPRPGDALPRIQHQLILAERRLEELRHQRHRLAQSVAELEAEAEHWGQGRLDEVQSTLETLERVFTEVGDWPTGTDRQRWRLFGIWARRLQERIDSLPAWQRRLSEYGEDPDYQAPGAPEERGWRVATERVRSRAELLEEARGGLREIERALVR